MADPVVSITNGVPTSGTGTITTLGQTLVDGANLTMGATTDAAVTAGAAGSLSAKLRSISRDIVANVVLAAGSNLIGLFKLTDGTNTAAVKAASTAAAATDPALVVTISPNGVNANISDGSGQTSSGHSGAPTVGIDQYSQYKTVPASATSQVLGATGAQYDYLAGLLIIPATSAAGAVSIADGNGSAISVFAGGGTTALSDLKPFLVPLGLHALASTTPGWKVTTGTNVSVIGIGKFT